MIRSARILQTGSSEVKRPECNSTTDIGFRGDGQLEMSDSSSLWTTAPTIENSVAGQGASNGASRTSRGSLLCRGLLGLTLAFSGLTACSGDGDESPTPPLSSPLEARFTNLTDGAQISGTVSIEVLGTGGGGISSLAFTAPAELVGQDTDASPEKLTASWDTTQDLNGQVTVTVEAKGMDGTTVTRNLTLTRSNVDAALLANYEDESYVRQGSPLIVNVKGSAFGANPSLARIEARQVSGGGLNPALPVQGVADGSGGFNFNLGTPTSGDVKLVFNAVNNDGQSSAPLILHLQVLRNDIISSSVLADFEVSKDGTTGLLLGSVSGSSDMRLDFISLTDPSNPLYSGASLTLQTGITSTGTGPVGNIVLNPADPTKAFILFPNSKVVYKIDIATKTVALKTNITSLLRPESGTSLQDTNRSPFVAISSDGNYLYAWDSAPTAFFVVVRTSDMVQLGVTQGQVTSPYPAPATTNTKGFGYMAVHPSNRLVYAVNNWGYDAAGSVDLAVFDVAAQAFVDFNASTARVVDAYSVENASSNNKVAQMIGVTKDGTRLLVPVCNSSTGATVLKRLRIDANTPTSITPEANIDLASVWCGGVAAISSDDRYVLVAGSSPNKPTGAVVDLQLGASIGVTFPNGVKDGGFSADNSKVFAESLAYASRDMGVATLSASPATVEELLVPGAAGLVPPDSDVKLRYNILTGAGNYLYQLYPATVNDGAGGVTTKGTSLSVFSVGLNDFIFPNAP